MTSLPEVCADSAIYCDPKDIGDIAEKIRMVLINNELQQDLAEKGIKNVDRFSWDKTANRFYKILNRLN